MENGMTTILIAVTATTRDRLRNYFGGKVDFLDWENYSERYEDDPRVPVGMFPFPIGGGNAIFEGDKTIYDRVYNPFIEAMHLISTFNGWETNRADICLEYHSDWLDFCIVTTNIKPFGND